MGDRGNIIIIIRDGARSKDVYLYTHWNGSSLEEIARAALVRRQRWTDAAYLARITFCEMLAHGRSGAKDESGYGISTSPPDNEHKFLVLDVDRQRVEWESEAHQTLGAMGFLTFVGGAEFKEPTT